MNKRRLKLLVIFIVAAIAICFSFSNEFSYVIDNLSHVYISMNKTTRHKTDISSENSFSIDEKTKLVLKYNIKVKKGSIKLQLLDDQDEIIKEFSGSKAGKFDFTYESGEYRVRLLGKGFVGTYHVKVY